MKITPKFRRRLIREGLPLRQLAAERGQCMIIILSPRRNVYPEIVKLTPGQ